jgi:CelD/BcsL family acetyltransferase involved in cellulose biosynthesis
MDIAMRALAGTYRTEPAAHCRIASVEIFEDLTAAEPHWRTLEREKTLTTPYQRYDFLKLWQLHVGADAGVTPFIVVGFDAVGAPLFLWPFGTRKLGGQRVAEFLGGKHANFNMALWRRDAAAKIGAEDLRAVLSRLAERADIVTLTNQPLTWAGTANPFALLPQQRSANFGFTGALVPDFEALFRARTNAAARKKMRKKERTLARYGEVCFERASGAHDVRRALDVFFKQKSARMRVLGVPDVFTAPGVRRFIEVAATEQISGGAPLIELYTLSVDDIIVATMGGIVGGGRFCAMFNSIEQGRYAIESPGEQLIVKLVRDCCERGLETFDLGIGEEHYKHLFCGDAEPLFDSYLPLSSAGRLLAVAFAMGAATKRAIKRHAGLWSLVRATRRLGARLSAIRPDWIGT